MAVAPPARRGPDIIQTTSIPLSATTDQPIDDVPRPPVSASRHPDDQAAGVAQEISAEELAAAESARRPTGVAPEEPIVPAKKDNKEPPEAKAKEGDEKSDDEDVSGIDTDRIAEGLPGYAAREITKVRNAARAARTAADLRTAAAEKVATEAREAAAAALKQIEELRAKVEPAEKPAEDLRPTRDQFDDPDLYDEALTEWGVREGVRKAEATRKAETAAAELAAKQKADDEARAVSDAEVARVEREWQDQRSKALERHADYAEIAEKATEEGGPTITNEMALTLLNLPNGTDVAYFLGQNTEESERIAGHQRPMQQVIEIVRISERLANPPRRAAPPRPITPIDTSRAPAGEDDAEPDMNSYAETRMAALNKARKPFFPTSNVH